MSASSSSTSNTERCKHFGVCGGCDRQDVPYSEQIRRKSEALSRLFSTFWDAEVEVASSPRAWNYRNKVEVNFSREHFPEPPPPGTPRRTVLGFKKPGAWYWTLDIDECRIAPAGLERLLESVRRWYIDSGLTGYTTRGGGDGFLRHLIVREGVRTGKHLVIVTTRREPLEGAFEPEAFVNAVHAAYPGAHVMRGINEGIADQAIPTEMETLFGEPSLKDRLEVSCSDGGVRGFEVLLSPFSFLQPNTLACEVLYAKIRGLVEKAKPSRLYDLYGGMGSIAMSCSDLVEEVISVESWAPASRDGERNAERNGMTNISFVPERVEAWLGKKVYGLRGQRGPDGKPREGRSAAGGLGEGATVIVDPPRSGLNPKALRRLIELAPERIVYVSCKPERLAEEMKEFSVKYDLVSLEAVDQFPHTPHVEALAELTLRQ